MRRGLVDEFVDERSARFTEIKSTVAIDREFEWSVTLFVGDLRETDGGMADARIPEQFDALRRPIGLR